MSTVADNPVDQAMSAESPARSYFGEVKTDWHFCVLRKGVGKEVYDPTQHSIDQRHVAIHIELIPFGSARFPNPNPIPRDMVEFEKEWVKWTMPSLKRLGHDLRTINGQWAHVKLTPTGETYTSKIDGSTKDKTAVQFIEVFPNKEACQAAADKLFGGNNGTPAMPVQPAVATTPPAATTSDRATAAKFLGPLWQASGKDQAEFLKLIASMPNLAQHFGPESAEVQQTMGAPF